jgi:hypothetical protein
MKKTIAYGFWPSRITAEQLSSASVRYAEPKIDQDTIYWLESRPVEKGRSVLVQYKNGQKQDLLPTEFNMGVLATLLINSISISSMIRIRRFICLICKPGRVSAYPHQAIIVMPIYTWINTIVVY